MHYLITVLPDRIQAEAAYTALEKNGLPLDHITILGKGYKSADEFGLIKPSQPALQQAKLMAYWLLPFGFVIGYTFDMITGITLFPTASSWGSHLLGGGLGAIFAALGSFCVGGGIGLLIGGGDALIYRNRLNAGKYLIVVTGSEDLTQKATGLLQRFNPENIQGYVEPEN